MMGGDREQDDKEAARTLTRIVKRLVGRTANELANSEPVLYADEAFALGYAIGRLGQGDDDQ